jgi:predicted nucleic acid-binding protein
VSAAARQPGGFVLDSHALLAYFEGETGGATVQQLVADAERRRCRLFLSLVNWGEITYIIRREKGVAAAQEIVARIDALPIRLRSIDRKLVVTAAELKARFPIAYADAFAAATGKHLDVPVVTGDPEFRRVEGEVKVLWTAGARP